jgi:DNA-directed RNA polymerase subunit N
MVGSVRNIYNRSIIASDHTNGLSQGSMNPRCYSCGLPVGHLGMRYQRQIEAGEKNDKVLDTMGIKSICCRIHFICYAKTLTETLAVMANQEPSTFEGGPLKIMKDNCNNRIVPSG